jgi:hypothetical protein
MVYPIQNNTDTNTLNATLRRKRPPGANSAPLFRETDSELMRDSSPTEDDVIAHVQGVAATHLARVPAVVVKVGTYVECMYVSMYASYVYV